MTICDLCREGKVANPLVLELYRPTVDEYLVEETWDVCRNCTRELCAAIDQVIKARTEK